MVATKDIKSKRTHGKVLLVEDEVDVRRWLERELSNVGMKVTSCGSRREAEAALSSQFFHAVVTDVYLEPQSPVGLELVHRATQLGIPSVIMSSRADLQVAKSGMNEGASYLIEKPFHAADLIAVLSRIWEEPKGLLVFVDRFMEVHQLTEKEKEVVRLLLKGLSNKEVAEVEGNSDRTIKGHLTNIFQKCGVQSRTELFNAIFPT